MTNENIDPKLIQLAKKLQVLAERGVGGEKLTAAAKLEQIVRKYNIDLSGSPVPTEHEYFIKTVHKELFFAVVWNTMPKWDGKYRVIRGSRRCIRLTCTELEHLEITAKFDIYARDYDKQRKQFLLAYILKNNICSGNASNDAGKGSDTAMSNEDIDILMNLMSGIRRTTVHPMLNEQVTSDHV